MANWNLDMLPRNREAIMRILKARETPDDDTVLDLETLRATFTVKGSLEGQPKKGLFDFLSGHIGTVDGSAEPLSRDTGASLRRVWRRSTGGDTCEALLNRNDSDSL